MIVSIGSIKFRLLLALVFAILSVASSHIAQFDQYWEKRATEAKEAARRAYHPDPETIVNDFNNHTLSYFRFGEDGNNTRRLLYKYRGKCMAINPIDRCWRCRKNWANRRKKLADCVIGFGRHTTGGKKGRYYVVTDPSDNDLVNPKPGTLRHAVIQPQPLWIIFKHSMIIRLTQELIMTSDKTIDGRGANVRINSGAGFMLQFVRNIIIHGIRIHQTKQGSGGMIRDSVSHYGLRSASDGDAISIFGSSNIWLDHLSMSSGVDGLVDAIEGSTAITISNCRMTHHDHVMLFGASDRQSADAKMQITVAFNHFGKGLVQRMPRVRWGFVHVVNNHYTHWKKYAIGGSQHPTIISQGNRFIAPPNPNAKEVTKREYSPKNIWKNWLWRSESDVMMDGAFFTQSGNKFQKYPKEGLVPSMHGSFASKLTMFSGALDCFKGRPC